MTVDEAFIGGVEQGDGSVNDIIDSIDPSEGELYYVENITLYLNIDEETTSGDFGVKVTHKDVNGSAINSVDVIDNTDMSNSGLVGRANAVTATWGRYVYPGQSLEVENHKDSGVGSITYEIEARRIL